MKTITRLLILLVLASAGAFAGDNPVARKVGESGVPGGIYACTRAELVEKMNARQVMGEPSWIIQVEKGEYSVATEAQRKAHERFIRFVRRNIAEGKKGDDTSPKSLHMTWLEFMKLHSLAASSQELALANWSKRMGAPAGRIASNMLSVIVYVQKKGDEATAEETAFAKATQEALDAFNVSREGKATDGQRATIKAYAESLAK